MALKLVAAAVDVAISAYDAHRIERAKRRAADQAYDTRRPHLWGDWEANREARHCAYCNVDQTAANEHALCPATGDPPRVA